MGRAPHLVSCLGVESDLALLPHFLDHYLGLGIPPQRLRLILNADGPEAPGLEEAKSLLRSRGVAEPEIWIAPYTSDSMWARRRDLQRRVAEPEDWVLNADVDEFHEYPEPLPAFLEHCEQEGVDCVQGVFIDRLAPEGRLAPVAPEPAVLEQFPLRADVGWSIWGRGASHGIGGTLKIMLSKGAVLPSRGGHSPVNPSEARYLYARSLAGFPELKRPEERFAVPTRVHHVHWTRSLQEKLERRLATPGVSEAGREYGQKQLDHLRRHGGVALDQAVLEPDCERPPWMRRVTRLRRRARWHSAWGVAKWVARGFR